MPPSRYLSGSPGAAVVVDYATAIGTASATDFSDTSGTLTFAANTTTLSQTFDVPVTTDSLVEGSETFTATLSANSSNPLPTGFSLGTATATATIGAAGTATVSIAGPTGNVNEGDDATFTVTLSGSPGAAVVVDYATAIGTASATDFSDTSGTLTFAANTTTLSQTFDVPVLDDPQVEGRRDLHRNPERKLLEPAADRVHPGHGDGDGDDWGGGHGDGVDCRAPAM